MTIKRFSFGLLLVASMIPAIAKADDVPKGVGQCVQTRISTLGSRLDGNPDSGDTVSYTNGIYGVSYDAVQGLRSARIGDTVVLCLSNS